MRCSWFQFTNQESDPGSNGTTLSLRELLTVLVDLLTKTDLELASVRAYIFPPHDHCL